MLQFIKTFSLINIYIIKNFLPGSNVLLLKLDSLFIAVNNDKIPQRERICDVKVQV